VGRTFVALLALLLSAACYPPVGEVVESTQGFVRGEAAAGFPGIVTFRGIPYAAPPVGPLRFAQAQPPAPWTGERDGVGFTPPPCVQVLGGTPIGSEDCLYLSITTHLGEYLGRPVIFLIHGGAMVGGYGGATLAPRMAAENDAVVVSINYRLNSLASFATPALAAENPHGSAGNNSLLDVIAALRWTVQNAGQFGGDPFGLSIYGNSAGGSLVAYVLASPLSQGLFWRAWASSPGLASNLLPSLTEGSELLASAFARGAEITAAAGCASAPDQLACMRALPAYDVSLAAASRVHALLPGANAPETWPNVDGYALLEQPAASMRAGTNHFVRIMGGTTRDEMTALIPANDYVFSQAHLEERITALFGPTRAAQLIPLYPSSAFPDGPLPPPKAAWQALLGDVTFNCSADTFLRAAADAPQRMEPVYEYAFDHRAKGQAVALGAFHTMDGAYWTGDPADFNYLAFFFHAIFDQEDADLTSFMVPLRRAFMRGEPFATFAWPEVPDVLALDGAGGLGSISIVPSARDGRCDALRAIGLLE
jgi:para-nitrobenzyl esterase